MKEFTSDVVKVAADLGLDVAIYFGKPWTAALADEPEFCILAEDGVFLHAPIRLGRTRNQAAEALFHHKRQKEFVVRMHNAPYYGG